MSRRISLRFKIFAHLLAVHAILAAIAVIVLLENRVWLLVVEVLFAASLVSGYLLMRAFFVPLDLIRTGAELIDEQDFASHFREVGQPEMDELIRIYNRMIDRLREERLRLEEQAVLLDQVFRVTPAGMITLGFDGEIADLNPAASALLGLPAAEASGRRLEAIPGSLGPALSAIPAGESRVVALGGRRRIRCVRTAFFDQGFRRSFFLLEELTDELRASEKAAYRKLIRMMSHEINNSVGAVTSLLESCATYAGQLAAPDREDFREALGVARSRLENLNAFMRGFADVVRIPPPEPRPCDLRALLDDIHLLLRPELERRRIVWTWTRADPIGPLLLDKNQIEQVLVNALRNALEAIGEDGRISLSLGREGNGVRLAIRDSGPGIPPEAAGSLFTPFFSTKRNGRGLGLTLVQEVLASHGFDFGLEGAPEGGAEFWFRVEADRPGGPPVSPS